MQKNTAKKQTVSQFELSNLIRKCRLFSKIKLKPASRLVLESLVYHFPNIRIYIETLQEETGCSEGSVKNALNELTEVGLILITRTGRSSIYKLTQKFFDLLEIEPQTDKKQSIRSTEIALPHNKQNKKDFKKAVSNSNIVHITGKNYPKYVPEKRVKESPLNLDKDQAIEFLNNLPAKMQNTFFALELRRKWEL